MTSPAAEFPSDLSRSMSAGQGPGPLWLICAAALAVALALPFFLVDVPPVLDYPNHLARIFVLAHPDDPVLSQIYAPHWRILPNLGTDIIGAGLLKFTTVHVGGRLLLALCLFAPVIGIVVYHRVGFGRFAYWPLASGIVAYSGVFLLGFMNFLLALGLAFIAAAAWIALRRRDALAGAIFVGVASSAVLLFCHIFGVALLALLIGNEELTRLYRRRKAGEVAVADACRIAGALVVVFIPALLLYLASPLSETAAQPGSWHGLAKLLALLAPFMTTSFALTALTALGFFSFLLLAWRSMAVAPAFPFSIAVLLLTFLVAPSTIKSGTFVDVRIVLMIVLLIFAGLSPCMTRRSALLAGAMFAALIVIRTGYIASTWIDHRADIADVRAAIAEVKPGSKVLVARGHPGIDTDVEKPERALPAVYRLDGHLGALLAIERKAFWPLMFADPAQQPVDVLPPYKTISQSPGEPIDLPLLQTDDRDAPSYIRNWRSNFDTVLLIDPPVPLPAVEGLAPVYTGAYAVLYRVRRR